MALFKARHRRRAKFGLRSGLRFIGFLSTLILLIGLALQWLVPGEWVQWRAEDYLTKRLAQPVSLPGAALGMFPLPHVRADALSVGDANHALLRGWEPRLFISLGGLLNGQPFQRVKLARLLVGAEALLAMDHGPSAIGLTTLEAEQVGLIRPDEEIGPGYALKLNRLPGERWLLELGRDDETLSARLERTGRWLRAEIDAAVWTLAGEAALRVAPLSAVLRLQPDAIELEPLELGLGEGWVRGSVSLMQDGEWRLSGSLVLEAVALEALRQSLGLPLFQGRADGSVYLSGSALTLEKLVSDFDYSGELDLARGELIGIDLESMPRRSLLGGFGGGNTPFDKAHVSVAKDASGVELTLRGLRSQRLESGGRLHVVGGQLTGELRVRRPPGSREEVSLLLGGTTRSPSVRADPDSQHADAWRQPVEEPDGKESDPDESLHWILREY